MKSRTQRREEGEARNAKWQALTPAQQLKELDLRPGQSKKQRDKLQKVLEKRA